MSCIHGLRPLVMSLVIVLAVSLCAVGRTDNIPYVRTVSTAAQPGDRVRALPRTLIFAELEPYGPYQNMMHYYTDRPLFTDIRDRQTNDWTNANFTRDTRICHDICGLDGLASLDYFNYHLSQLKGFEKKSPALGYTQMIVIPGYADVDDAVAYRSLKHMILEAAKSRYTTRVEDKLLMWAYGGGCENQRAIARKLRTDPDIPPFLFVAEIPFMDIYNAFGMYVDDKTNPRPIPSEIVEAYRTNLVEFARDVDGFNMWCTTLRRDHLGELPTHADKTDIFRSYLMPIANEVLNRPENCGKIVGSWVRQGYVNPFAGVTDGEYGTETLRNYLDSIVLMNPDILMCFEWNEANENTHFQPTVAHGKTFARVLNYYRSLLDRTSPKPMSGDDLSVPNLVVSIRQAIKLGEPWHCELLYLPDGSTAQEVVATLTLRRSDGRVIRTFPAETFSTKKLCAVDYRIPSEHLSDNEALSISLETEYLGRRQVWDGFDSTRVRATVCRDYLYSHMPLREQLVPLSRPVFTVCEKPSGERDVAATIAADEELASFELLEDLQEVGAAPDAENAWDKSKYAIFRGAITALLDSKFGTGAGRVRQGLAWFEGSSNAVIRTASNPRMPFCVLPKVGVRNPIRITFGGRCIFFAMVPKDELADSRLVMDIEDYGRVESRLDDVWRLGKLSQSLPMTVRLDLWREDALPDYSLPLGVKSAAFGASVRALGRFPGYQVRAITKSGKVWRSGIAFPKRHKPETRRIPVWSDIYRAASEAEVFADAIPDITYVFDPKWGSWLRNTWDQLYDAKLGGGGLYGEPMYRAERFRRLPRDFVRPDPVWTNLDGMVVLRFEKGSFLQFPHETMPRGAPYTMTFEIRPDDAADQVLIRTRGVNDKEAHLTAFIKNGTLHLTPYGIGYYRYPDLDSGLIVRPGEWNRIAIAKDFTRFRVVVNGHQKDFAYDRRARMYQGFVFGGNVQPGENLPVDIRPFTGCLRAFRIRHEFLAFEQE